MIRSHLPIGKIPGSGGGIGMGQGGGQASKPEMLVK